MALTSQQARVGRYYEPPSSLRLFPPGSGLAFSFSPFPHRVPSKHSHALTRAHAHADTRTHTGTHPPTPHPRHQA